MRVLIIARCRNGRYAPFISEQVEAIERYGVECSFFPVIKNGIAGYLSCLPKLKKAIQAYQPNLIHAHYGLCGLLSNLQRRVPVVTTYHGSDINNPKVFPLSKIAIRLSAFNIFVSHKNLQKASPKTHFALIPCGINLNDYPEIDKAEARKQMALTEGREYVLFAGAFDNKVKNAPLAFAATKMLKGVELLEFKGFTRQKVAILLQAVDALLMTSHTEGSPQVIKEAMACNCPIVSVDVGDVRHVITGTKGCFIAERSPMDIADKLGSALVFGKTKGRGRITHDYESRIIAQKIVSIYNEVLNHE